MSEMQSYSQLFIFRFASDCSNCWQMTPITAKKFVDIELLIGQFIRSVG